MTKPEKRALVPALRFPEFQNAGEWEQLPVGDKVDLLSGYPFKSEEISEDANGIPLMRGINITEGYIRHSPDMDRFFLGNVKKLEKYFLKIDDLVIGMDGSKVGKNSALITKQDSGALLIQRVARLRTNCKATISFIFQHIHSTKFHSYVDRINTSGGIPHISANQINEFEICFPPNDGEQQKIADCLSSLDDLITAQTQKLVALKAHKKGLMQQLFPAEGETVPKLRFPEFRDGGEWLEICLKELCERIMDGTHFSPKTKDGSRMYLTSKNIQDGKINLSNISYISEEEHNVIYEKCPVKLNDVLLTKDGANTGNCALNTIDSEFSLLSSVAVLRGNASLIDQGFLYQMILSDKTQRIIKESMSGQAITRITLDKIGNFTISITDLKEQQKIADCLSSIDDLITAQGEKIEALKSHKKGLMQQLFPSMDEDNHPPPAAYPSRGGELRDEPFPSSGGVDSEAGRGGSPPTTGRGD